MTSARPRLIYVSETGVLSEQQQAALRLQFELIEVDSPQAALDMMKSDPNAMILTRPSDAATLATAPDSIVGDLSPVEAFSVLQHIGEGVGVVDADGRLIWSNVHLAQNTTAIDQFIQLCQRAIDLFNRESEFSVPAELRHTRRFDLSNDGAAFELFVSPASSHPDHPDLVQRVVGVLCDVTETKRLEQQIDAINTAGSELMRIEASDIASLDAPRRLKFIEDKIVNYVRGLLHFDNFEIRLHDRESNELKLVIARGISPLRIGEVMYADAEGNGICGHVAATGESYLCRDISSDPRYREGLNDAASSLTVPLKLHDRVIGVLNVESRTRNAFDENDRRFAEIFARYIAMAMNILDLLVIERYTTNERVTANVVSEMNRPLSDLEQAVEDLRDRLADPSPDRGELLEQLQRVADLAQRTRRTVQECTQGPRTIIAAEEELNREEPDPVMIGKRVLVADDEPNIRGRIGEILRQRGCEVTECADGMETIEIVERDSAEGCPYDLIISDINMPKRNGYEVFRATKEVAPNTPVILMTGFGYDPHHSIMRASQEGLHCFLFKPLRATQLIEEVGKALSAATVNSDS